MAEEQFVSTSIFDFEEDGEESTLLDVSSHSDFVNALDEIAIFAAPVKLTKVPGQRRKCCVPRLFLHISCHGNEDGIAFTNGDVITWHELKTHLTDLTKRLHLFRPDEVSAACMTLCMSSCCGLYARAMADDKYAVPFHALVGCKSNIEWTDSITAYNTFYHQVITKERSVPRAINAINEASLSKEIFELVTAYDVGAIGFTNVTPVVLMSTDIDGKMRWAFDTQVGKLHIPYLWDKDNLYHPDTQEPIIDPATGDTPIYFDDPEKAVEFMQSNPTHFCQVERGAAQDINIRYAHKF